MVTALDVLPDFFVHIFGTRRLFGIHRETHNDVLLIDFFKVFVIEIGDEFLFGFTALHRDRDGLAVFAILRFSVELTGLVVFFGEAAQLLIEFVVIQFALGRGTAQLIVDFLTQFLGSILQAILDSLFDSVHVGIIAIFTILAIRTVITLVAFFTIIDSADRITIANDFNAGLFTFGKRLGFATIFDSVLVIQSNPFAIGTDVHRGFIFHKGHRAFSLIITIFRID